MNSTSILMLSLFFFNLIQGNETPIEKFSLSGYAQGTTWHITYYASHENVHKTQIDSILTAIDSSLSIYKIYSVISQFNNSKNGILMDEHLKNVVIKSLEVYRQTFGLSDITVYPLVDAWSFGNHALNQLPDSIEIANILKCVSSSYLKIENNFLRKQKPCVKIDVNGIAQGYSVDVIANFLEKKGILNYIVELGGELRVHGKKMNNENFTVGIETPTDDDFGTHPLDKILVIDSGAITTSGNYRKYYESNGKKYSHIINPQTGYPIQNEMISVTVYAKDAITADAFDNALMAMGLQRALHFLSNRKDMDAWIIYQTPEGRISDTGSVGFYKLLKK